MNPLTQRWKELFRKNCREWNPRDQQRYLNIPNDPEEVDEVELESARELIQEINGRPPVE